MCYFLEEKLEARIVQGNLRSLRKTKNLIDFASNDYLGLAKSKRLSLLIENEVRQQENVSNGSTGSRLLTGNSDYAEELESGLAEFHGYESALLFNCGYMANIGLLSSIAGPSDTLFYDINIHASMHDGMHLTRAQLIPFKHNDMNSLEKRLQRNTGANRFICVESIYSTDGSQAPLKDLCSLAQRYNAHLIVDEAHAVGIVGPAGRGLVAEHNLMPFVFAQIVTFGKAVGTHGAAILGSSTLKKYLINFARSSIYTTALPLHTLASIRCSYALFPTLEKERAQLQELMIFFSGEITPIRAVIVPGNEEVKRASKQLEQDGFDVRALTSPTVKRGTERLRITLHAYNTTDELKTLLANTQKMRST